MYNKVIIIALRIDQINYVCMYGCMLIDVIYRFLTCCICLLPFVIMGHNQALASRDMIGIAFTGSGKTLTFGLPLVTVALEEELRMPILPGEGPIGICLAPSRYVRFMHVFCMLLFSENCFMLLYIISSVLCCVLFDSSNCTVWHCASSLLTCSILSF